MKSIIVKIISAIAICAVIIGVSTLAVILLAKNRSQQNAKIISSSFAGYDFARAVTGDPSQVSMLLKPGAEMHSYEPTPDDIKKLKESALFIYIGSESEHWIEDLVANNEIPADKTLRLMDLVETKLEDHSHGDEDYAHEEKNHTHNDKDHAHGDEDHTHDDGGHTHDDEHIWTNPVNAMKLVEGIKNRLSELAPERSSEYNKNATAYNERLSVIDQKIRDVVADSDKKELIFADRFPFRYLVDEYGLKYTAAFPGCSEQTEASSNTIARLIDKIKSSNIKVILKIELTSDKLAKIIANETGAKILELNAAHNISQKDFDKGVTYADIMEKNIKVLKEASE